MEFLELLLPASNTMGTGQKESLAPFPSNGLSQGFAVTADLSD